MFESRQLLFLSLDMLAENHNAVMRLICSFLEIHPVQIDGPIHEAEGPAFSSPSADDITYLRQIYQSDLCRFAKLTGLDVWHWLNSS
jgi:hypothetical protein